MNEDRGVYAGMATMPSRAHTFPIALKSILPQVDKLFLFLDAFTDQIPEHPKIVQFRSQVHGDLKANGKLLGLTKVAPGAIYVTVDDDILYPGDFVSRMRHHLDRLGPRTAAGVHGCVLDRENFRSYLNDRSIYVRGGALSTYREVDVVGTCAVAFRKDEIDFDVRNWTITNMVDLHFALECETRGIARHLVPRREGWLGTLEVSQQDSIFAQLKKDDSRQTALARKLLELSAHRPPPEVRA